MDSIGSLTWVPRDQQWQNWHAQSAGARRPVTGASASGTCRHLACFLALPSPVSSPITYINCLKGPGTPHSMRWQAHLDGHPAPPAAGGATGVKQAEVPPALSGRPAPAQTPPASLQSKLEPRGGAYRACGAAQRSRSPKCGRIRRDPRPLSGDYAAKRVPFALRRLQVVSVDSPRPRLGRLGALAAARTTFLAIPAMALLPGS